MELMSTSAQQILAMWDFLVVNITRHSLIFLYEGT